MKTMTCKQLGGACDLEFTANTFDEIAQMSKTHGMQMFQENDAQHLEAMQKIQALMQDPSAMQKWFEDKKAEFENLEDN
jgi:predicted small metal-binding protein